MTTPALLFSSISLLFLAYTNRFLVLAQLIRQLHAKDPKRRGQGIARQIDNLRTRISLIREMQMLGVLSFVFCAGSMFAIFLGQDRIGEWIFGVSLLLLIISLLMSLREVQISCVAIDIELSEIEENQEQSSEKRLPDEDERDKQEHPN